MGCRPASPGRGMGCNVRDQIASNREKPSSEYSDEGRSQTSILVLLFKVKAGFYQPFRENREFSEGDKWSRFVYNSDSSSEGLGVVPFRGKLQPKLVFMES
jgi:hypothetical protein